MDGVALSHEGDGSDYGSDFSFDEETLLGSPLQQPTAEPYLILRDIKDNESPRGARVPRVLGRKKHSLCKPERMVSMEINGHRSVSAPGKSIVESLGNTD